MDLIFNCYFLREVYAMVVISCGLLKGGSLDRQFYAF